MSYCSHDCTAHCLPVHSDYDTVFMNCSTSCSVEDCSPSKEEMCSSLFGLRNQTLSPSSTSGSCSVSESCTTLSCALSVVYSGINLPLSLETTLLPCSDPYGVHLLITSSLLGDEIVNDTFTQSRNLTISVFDSDAYVIVDITQKYHGLILSVSCCYFYLLLFTNTVLFTISQAKVFIGESLLELIPPTNSTRCVSITANLISWSLCVAVIVECTYVGVY